MSHAPVNDSRPGGEPLDTLSERGIVRREAMLADLQGAMRRRRRVRTATRAGGATALALAIGLGLYWTGRTPPTPTRPTASEPEVASGPDTRGVQAGVRAIADSSRFDAPLGIRVVTTVVGTDPLAGTHVMVLTAGPSRIRRVDDGELVATLRERGIDAGVAHIGGRSRLVKPTATP